MNSVAVQTDASGSRADFVRVLAPTDATMPWAASTIRWGGGTIAPAVEVLADYAPTLCGSYWGGSRTEQFAWGIDWRSQVVPVALLEWGAPVARRTYAATLSSGEGIKPTRRDCDGHPSLVSH